MCIEHQSLLLNKNDSRSSYWRFTRILDNRCFCTIDIILVRHSCVSYFVWYVDSWSSFDSRSTPTVHCSPSYWSSAGQTSALCNVALLWPPCCMMLKCVEKCCTCVCVYLGGRGRGRGGRGGGRLGVKVSFYIFFNKLSTANNSTVLAKEMKSRLWVKQLC